MLTEVGVLWQRAGDSASEAHKADHIEVQLRMMVIIILNQMMHNKKKPSLTKIN